MNKKYVLYGLVILAIAGLIYLAVPKYQINSVRVDDDTIVVIKLNTITGQVSTSYEPDNEDFEFTD